MRLSPSREDSFTMAAAASIIVYTRWQIAEIVAAAGGDHLAKCEQREPLHNKEIEYSEPVIQTWRTGRGLRPPGRVAAATDA